MEQDHGLRRHDFSLYYKEHLHSQDVVLILVLGLAAFAHRFHWGLKKYDSKSEDTATGASYQEFGGSRIAF